MKTTYKLHLKIDKKDKIILFGIPDEEEELRQMFLLREKVYKEHNYINANSDKDDYDKNGKCTYFIAKLDDDVMGTVRLILDNPLPTQKECFDFKEPLEMEEIPAEKRGELSRLISVPYKNNIYIPRHLIMAFLLASACKQSKEMGVLGGYSFITTRLYDKMNKMKIPFKVVGEFEQKYPQTGLLYPYFSNKNNKILPIYYKLKKIILYLENLFNNRMMFEKIGNNEFRIKDNFYNKFLRFLKVI